MSSEHAADVADADLPPHVLAAAHNLFRAQNQGRQAENDEEALSFVQGMVAESKREFSEAASAGSSSEVPGVPPNVLAAAHDLFLRHQGRPAESAAEALAFARDIVAEGRPDEGVAVAVSANSTHARSLEVPPHVVSSALAIFEQHMGRPAATLDEALEFAQRVVAASRGETVPLRGEPQEAAAGSALAPVVEEPETWQQIARPAVVVEAIPLLASHGDADEELDVERAEPATQTCCSRPCLLKLVHRFEATVEPFTTAAPRVAWRMLRAVTP